MNIVENQHKFFATQHTFRLSKRIEALKILKQLIKQSEKTILKALNDDLGKSSFEGYTSEIYPCLQEINFFLNNVSILMSPQKVKTPWILTPLRGFFKHVPRGVVLIIGSWNFPFLLMILPLIGAIAAGNCVILKPSENAPQTYHLLSKLIANTFDPSFITVLAVTIAQMPKLLEEKFNYIFFTGSPQTGKIVLQAAAKHLTPVTLELGGSNSCIVDESICINIAAKRIAWGKFYNAGQNCLAPNYLLIHKSIKHDFLKALCRYTSTFYTQYYTRIINSNHFERLSALLQEGTIIYGGKIDKKRLFIEPTIIENISTNSRLLDEEIFGPILPIITYENIQEALSFIKKYPNQLVCYLFSKNRSTQKQIIEEIQAANISINDMLIPQFNLNLPFGGVNESGFGNYHGIFSFRTFSYQKTVSTNSFLLDNVLRYPPYDKLSKWCMKFLSYLTK